jgi:hypothetical protein
MKRPSMGVSFGVALLAGGFAALAAAAERLPDYLVGFYTARSEHLAKVIPVEMTKIKVTGEKVTGVISRYSNSAGTCVADSTPFTGTYKDGILSIKSRAMMSRRAGVTCGRMVLNAKVSGGRVIGTFGLGEDRGTPIDLGAK